MAEKPPLHPGRTPTMQYNLDLNKYSFNEHMKYNDFWLANKKLRPLPTQEIFNQLVARSVTRGNGRRKTRKTRRRKIHRKK